MNKKQKAFRGLLGAFCLSYMMLSYAGLALAQTQYSTNDPAAVRQYTGVESTIKTYLCTPTRGNVSGAGGDLYSCIQKLYRFCVVTAAVGGLVYIVYSGYQYMSAGGSTEAVTAAKSRIYSVIIAFVILSMGYVFLKFLNPDLVEFRPIQPLAVTAPPSQLVPGNTQALAQQILGSNRIAVNSSSCDCPGNCPNRTLAQLSQGAQATFDGPGSTCNAGTTNVNTAMLGALLALANSGTNFTITSLTGGHHSSASDPHYAGRAVDLVPGSPNTQTQASVVQSLRRNGASQIAVECNLNGRHIYTPLTGSNDSTNQCIGQPGYHIHAQW